MRIKWTEQAWQKGRAARRRISESVSKNECGRSFSKNDADLRSAFGGRRNLPFASTKDLENLARDLD